MAWQRPGASPLKALPTAGWARIASGPGGPRGHLSGTRPRQPGDGVGGLGSSTGLARAGR
jgi:hypothetical protein